MNRTLAALPLFAVVALSTSCDERDRPAPARLTPIAEPRHDFAQVVEKLRAADESGGAYVRDGFTYATRLDDAGQRVWSRTSLATGTAQVLLRERELGVHGALGSLEVSPNQKWLAYSARPANIDRYAVHVKELASGESAAPVISGADFSVAWSKDNTLYYAKLDKTGRSARVYALQPKSHRLPQLVHEEAAKDRELMVGAADKGPALFVRGRSSSPGGPASLLAYRLDPLVDVDGPRVDDDVVVAPADAGAPCASAEAAPQGGGSLTGDVDDGARRVPSVR